MRLDAPEAGAGGGEGQSKFQDASISGDRAFFTDGSRLTTDATSSEETRICTCVKWLRSRRVNWIAAIT